MTRHGWLTFLLLTGAGCGLEDPSKSASSGEEQTPAQGRSRETVEAFQALECEALAVERRERMMLSPVNTFTEDPSVELPPKVVFPFLEDLCEDCEEAINRLSGTTEQVESDLLTLVVADPRLHVRARAARILVSRRCHAVGSLLAEMCTANDPKSRYVGLSLYADAITEKSLPAPDDFSRILAIYPTEPHKEVKDKMARFLGAARAKVAVEVLLGQVGKENCGEALWALGEIRDPRAVPVLIEKFPNGSVFNESIGHRLMEALGKLNTTEAVDFIICHLDTYRAPDALRATGSNKALPALKAHLAKLKTKHGERDDLADTRIAITRLSYTNPTGPLMALAENREEQQEVRRAALEALAQYDSKTLHPRILKLFKSEKEYSLRHVCIDRLQDSALEGVIEALTVAFLTPKDAGEPIAEDIFQDHLMQALKKRLKTSFRTEEELRNYLRQRQAQQP